MGSIRSIARYPLGAVLVSMSATPGQGDDVLVVGSMALVWPEANQCEPRSARGWWEQGRELSSPGLR